MQISGFCKKRLQFHAQIQILQGYQICLGLDTEITQTKCRLLFAMSSYFCSMSNKASQLILLIYRFTCIGLAFFLNHSLFRLTIMLYHNSLLSISGYMINLILISFISYYVIFYWTNDILIDIKINLSAVPCLPKVSITLHFDIDDIDFTLMQCF